MVMKMPTSRLTRMISHTLRDLVTADPTWLPIGVMETSSPFLCAILSMTEPTEASGTSAIMRSIGSQSLPSMVLLSTCGVETWNS